MVELSNFYIISLKWTYPNSAAFTLWGKDNSGYCWRKEQAGLYSFEDINTYKNYYNNKIDSIAVNEELINELFVTAEYDNKISQFLLNNKKIRQIIRITKEQLQGEMSNIKLKELKICKK